MSDKVIILTDSNFEEEVLNSNIPVLVDFWAAWCGPCRMVAPTIDSIAEDYNNKIKVGKLNVDEYGNIAAKYNIMSIPTVYVFKNGEPVEKLIGVKSKNEYDEIIKKHI
ncbi:MAG TPA: thioredoxin [Thermoanaerobacterales bacterium]|nr:thioredoxin [Thermoanaerobacterales bacterium]